MGVLPGTAVGLYSPTAYPGSDSGGHGRGLGGLEDDVAAGLCFPGLADYGVHGYVRDRANERDDESERHVLHGSARTAALNQLGHAALQTGDRGLTHLRLESEIEIVEEGRFRSK